MGDYRVCTFDIVYKGEDTNTVYLDHDFQDIPNEWVIMELSYTRVLLPETKLYWHLQ